MKIFLRLLGNAVLGLCLLFVFNWLGASIGLAANVTAAGIGTVALLGVPGFALLLLLQCMAA